MKYIILLSLIISQCHQRNADDIVVTISITKMQLEESMVSNEKQYTDLSINQKEINEIWKSIIQLLPHKYIERYVTTLNVISDGPEEILAGVLALDESNQKWSFEVDIEDYRTYKNDEDYRHTLIHEFGHILTLNDTQVEPSDMKFQEGDRYLTNEGLAKPKSYIQSYTDQFWKGSLLDRWDRIQRIKNEYKKYNAILSLYESNKSHFWTDYAAESPEEDIAESWYYFIINDSPKGDSVKNKKLIFFSHYEELNLMREEIRKKIGLN